MAASGSLDSFQFYVVHNSFERHEHGSWDILQFVLFRRMLAELHNQAKFLFEIFHSNNINNVKKKLFPQKSYQFLINNQRDSDPIRKHFQHDVDAMDRALVLLEPVLLEYTF